MSNTVMKLSVVILGTAVCAMDSAAAEKPECRWDHQPGKSLSLTCDGKTIWSYHFATDGGFPYIHPLATADGRVLTEMSPGDHAWHRAVWFSWKLLQWKAATAGNDDSPAKLNSANYWDWARTKNGKPKGQTKPIGKETVNMLPDGAEIVAKLHYLHGDKLVIEEQRCIRVENPRADGSYAMDWTMTFTAKDTQVVFERTDPKKKSWGGYGGFSFRANNAMKKQTVIDSEGRTGKQVHGKPANWADFSGELDGKTVGVAIFDHPKNPRHPTPWYVATGGMGYLNPAFLFHEPFTLPKGESFTLKYRMLVHPSPGTPAALQKEYEAFKTAR